jgi:hypothetical protein
MSVVDSSTVAARPSMKRTVAAVVSTDGAEYDPGMDHIEKAPRIDDEVFDCAGLAPPEIKDFNLNYPYMLDQVGGKNLPWKVVGSSLISHECLKTVGRANSSCDSCLKLGNSTPLAIIVKNSANEFPPPGQHRKHWTIRQLVNQLDRELR